MDREYFKGFGLNTDFSDTQKLNILDGIPSAHEKCQRRKTPSPKPTGSFAEYLQENNSLIPPIANVSQHYCEILFKMVFEALWNGNHLSPTPLLSTASTFVITNYHSGR